MSGPLDITDGRDIGSKDEWRVSFASVLASNTDPRFFSVIQLGAGQGISQAASSLNLTSGTTANAETIIRSKKTFSGDLLLRYAALLSQRIINNNFFVELVDVLGDNLAYTINSATSVTVTIPNTNFTSDNIGQFVYLGAIAGTAGVIPGRYAIASVSGENVTFTVSAWPSSGTGTLSIFGYNYHHVLYDGTVATNAKYDAQRYGWATGDTTATISTTVSPGHIGTIAGINGTASFFDQTTLSATASEVTQRASRVMNVPTNDVSLYLQIRSVNGTTAPASTTTFGLNFISITKHDAPSVSLAGIMPFSQNFVLPVAVPSGLTANLGVGGVAATSLGKAEDAVAATGDTGVAMLGVRIPTTPASPTSAAGDYGALAIDLEGKQVQAPYAGMEVSWQAAPVTLTTTGSTALKASAGGALRNFITDITIANTSATGTRVDILDNATVIRSFWSAPTSNVTQSFSMPLKGTAATAVNVQLGTAVTDVRVSANGYLGI